MSYNLPFKDGQKILECGGGDHPLFHPNLDVRAAPTVDIVCNLEEELAVPSNSYDGVFASYLIEHLSWRKVKNFLKEIWRALQFNGTVVFITANTEAQMSWVLAQENWDDRASSIIFGDQNYSDNAHKNSLSPKYAIELLQEIGFINIYIVPWGQLGTDMIIEATKPNRQELFDKSYFNGGKKVGGYAHEGYWDYPVHYITAQKIIDLKPQSVLSIGEGRGYVIKKLQDIGLSVGGLEISRHCHLTRVVDNITEWDICQIPWQIPDKYFDLAVSVAVLEHISEEFLSGVMAELARVSHRGLHGIDFGDNDDGFDKTHCTLRPQAWWQKIIPDNHQIVNKEFLETPDNTIWEYLPVGDNKLKINFGSFITMFHYGWLNVDIIDLRDFAKKYGYKFYQFDARNKLPFEDNSADFIYSSHFLEHLTYEEGKKFLQECQRILKADGLIRLILPDAELLINKYKNNDLNFFDEINDGSAAVPWQAGKLWSLLFAGHQAAYDWQTISNLASDVGLIAEKKSFRVGDKQMLTETLDVLPELSLFVEIHK